MRRVRLGRPSAAMVVALCALGVALGGTSYAAVSLPKNSVGAAQLRQNAVTSSKVGADAVTSTKVKNGSLLARDFKSGQLPAGPQGPTGAQGERGAQGAAGTQGPAGAQGAPGTAVAYARVNISTGAVDAKRSMNISQSQVAAATSNPGIVCFHDLGFTVKNVVASPVATYGIATDNRTYVSVAPNSVAGGCPSSSPASFDNVAFVSAFDVGPLSPAFSVDVWFQ